MTAEQEDAVAVIYADERLRVQFSPPRGYPDKNIMGGLNASPHYRLEEGLQ